MQNSPPSLNLSLRGNRLLSTINTFPLLGLCTFKICMLLYSALSLMITYDPTTSGYRLKSCGPLVKCLIWPRPLVNAMQTMYHGHHTSSTRPRQWQTCIQSCKQIHNRLCVSIIVCGHVAKNRSIFVVTLRSGYMYRGRDWTSRSTSG